MAGAVRTPIGKFGGALASLTAAQLGAAAASEALRRSGIAPGQVGEAIIGCARQAGGGPNVARQVAFRAGIRKCRLHQIRRAAAPCRWIVPRGARR